MQKIEVKNTEKNSVSKDDIISALNNFSSFKNAVLAGVAKIEEIDDWVDVWHLSESPASDKSLREYLGFSKDEYASWMKNSSEAQKIIGI